MTVMMVKSHPGRLHPSIVAKENPKVSFDNMLVGDSHDSIQASPFSQDTQSSPVEEFSSLHRGTSILNYLLALDRYF